MLAVFEEGYHDNFRRFCRRKADKPAIILHAFAELQPFSNWFDASWAEPVFPQTFTFGRAANAPVPPSFTTAYIPQITSWMLS